LPSVQQLGPQEEVLRQEKEEDISDIRVGWLIGKASADKEGSWRGNTHLGIDFFAPLSAGYSLAGRVCLDKEGTGRDVSSSTIRCKHLFSDKVFCRV
jgi:hypothetical protein